jgi:hypothetical protein
MSSTPPRPSGTGPEPGLLHGVDFNSAVGPQIEEVGMVHSKQKTHHRGGNPDVPKRAQRPDDPVERSLEEGLEESFPGSDPVSITQPARSKTERREDPNAKPLDGD